MIDPTKIPQLDLGKISALEAAAGKLKSVGGDVKTTGANVHSTFQGLSGFYDAPEAGLLLNSTHPVKTQSETFGHDTTGVGAALAAFAAEIRPIAVKLQSLHGKAVSFQNEVKGDHHWQDDNGKVDENNQLLHDINGAVVQLMAAERKAANAIEAAFGGTRRWHAGNSKNDPNAYGVNNIPDDANAPWGSHEKHRAWYDKFGDWVGDHVVPDWGWAQAAWGGYSSFLKGFWVDGVWGTLTGLYKLSTMNAILDPKSFVAAWKGVGLLGLDGAMWVTPGLGSGMTLAAKSGALPKPVANLVNDANKTGLNFAKGLVAWDEWGKDPARAGGAVTFNVVTAVLPGPKGGGAMAKLLGGLGEDAGKVGVAAEDASRAGTVTEDAGKLGDLAETTPHVDLPTAGDLAKDFDVPSVGDDLPHVGDDLPNVGEHAPGVTDTPSLPGHDPVPAHPGDAPGAAHDPVPSGGAHDPVPPGHDPVPPGGAHDPVPPGDHGPAPGHDPVPPGGEHPTPDGTPHDGSPTDDGPAPHDGGVHEPWKPSKYPGMKETAPANALRGRIGDDLSHALSDMRGDRVVGQEIKLGEPGEVMTKGFARADHAEFVVHDGKIHLTEIKTGDSSLSPAQEKFYPRVPGGDVRIGSSQLKGFGLPKGHVLKPGEIPSVRVERWDIDSMPKPLRSAVEDHGVFDVLEGKAGGGAQAELTKWLHDPANAKIEKAWWYGRDGKVHMGENLPFKPGEFGKPISDDLGRPLDAEHPTPSAHPPLVAAVHDVGHVGAQVGEHGGGIVSDASHTPVHGDPAHVDSSAPPGGSGGGTGGPHGGTDPTPPHWDQPPNVGGDRKLGPEYLNTPKVDAIGKDWVDHRFGGLTRHDFLDKWTTHSGGWDWSKVPHEGYVPKIVGGVEVADKFEVELAPGTQIDRFGQPGGGFLSPDATPYEQRAIPPENLVPPPSTPVHMNDAHPFNYYRYEVVKPFKVDAGVIAPAFEQPGGGIQYVLNGRHVPGAPARMNVEWLLDHGYLRELPSR